MPNRRCAPRKDFVLGQVVCDCPVKDCSEVTDFDRCLETPCPEEPKTRCDFVKNEVGAWTCGCPAKETPAPTVVVVTSCEEVKDLDACLETECPERPGQFCDIRKGWGGVWTCGCPTSPPPSTCREVPLDVCGKMPCPQFPGTGRMCEVRKDRRGNAMCDCPVKACGEVTDLDDCLDTACPLAKGAAFCEIELNRAGEWQCGCPPRVFVPLPTAVIATALPTRDVTALTPPPTKTALEPSKAVLTQQKEASAVVAEPPADSKLLR
eukprot:TRINITY_DN1860_c0_g1_i5.p3 TRINITY_DN1860_c0_g1~~TRINITY_DN1860_c0_g1_i5.p3  ORF type:complete len:311 (+),score=118.41 TRINITY_DN1860_c0_g1_i5:141-935(+)